MFSKRAYEIFECCIKMYHQKDDVNQTIQNPYTPNNIDHLLFSKCWTDTLQWHYEDMIRDEHIDPALALSLKRKIDACNQVRTDLVEKIDDYFLDKYKDAPKKEEAEINTESPAWAIDRLSILALKIYHMDIEVSRKGVSKDHMLLCNNKLQILLEQKKDLSTSINLLIKSIGRGDKQMKVYRQMKMYNDASLNPILYNKKKMRSSIRKVLVIRFSAIGDVAMSSHVLLRLVKTYPDLEITVLSKHPMAPLFEDIPKVHFFPANTAKQHKGLYGLIKLSKELKTMNFDAIADIHNVLRSRVLCLLMKVLNPQIKIKRIDKSRKRRKALIRSENKVFKPLRKINLKYADVFKELNLPIKTDKTDILSSRRFPKGLISYDKKIGIAPFAAFKSKTYPLIQMEEVIKKISQYSSLGIFLFGGKENIVPLDELKEKYKNTLSTCRFSFRDQLAVISNLDLMISMDSANVHLAGRYGIKTITIWGVTHPLCGFEVFGENNTNLIPDRKKFPLIPTSIYGSAAPKGYAEAISDISPKAIIDKVIQILEL